MTEEHCAHQAKVSPAVVMETMPPAPVMPLESHESNNNAAAIKIVQDFKAVVNDAESLDQAAKYLLKELVDDAIFAVALEIHQLRKTGNLTALDGVPEDATNAENAGTPAEGNAVGGSNVTTVGSPSAFVMAAVTISGSAALSVGATAAISGSSSSLRKIDSQNHDIFGVSTAKKPMECNCPNCERLVSASRFAPHLEKCMGMGRLSSRIASRRLATKDVNSGSNSLANIGAASAGGYGAGNAFLAGSSPYLQLQGAAMTDDEDDVDWSSTEKRRKKNNSTRNNGTKKNNGKASF